GELNHRTKNLLAVVQ
ncbi:HWE histidine kinase domain-containing protein, partial [Devosia ureilytica]